MTEASHKPDKRILRSKAALKQSLLELMRQKDFASISTTEIVKHADFNRGTFYAHYEHKEALLEDIINDLLSGLIESFRKPYEQIDSFELERFPASAVTLFDHIYANAELYALMVDQKVMPGFREKMFHALKQTSIEDLIPQLHEIDNRMLDHELLVVYQMHALLGLTFHWIQEGFKQTPAYMAEQLVLFLRVRPTTVVAKRGPAGSGK
ncbi:TetR/AcrR family transcriptional regulator [Paenibacillus gorillae]|uniref:TetR/AcrR family transcriptional regulator n=1 Tax=Paenibacillus gorillae TaxID=1243662 RepID=UPI0004B0B3BB|nr:TetR/AcrR family transcriptional regulator [Paenibacillus gorillae]